MKTLLTIAVALFSLTVIAQPQKKSVVIGAMTTRPNALLIVNPENSDQGVLLPQLSTSQRMSMNPTSPAEDGLIVYDTNHKSYFYWSDGMWVKLNPERASGTSYYSIDPVSFRALKPGNTTRHNNTPVFETDNTFVAASRSGKVIAPVDLPHGAMVEELTVFYMDNDNNNLKVSLMRKGLSGNTEEIISWESSGSSAAVESILLKDFFNDLAEIDLENHTYRIVVEFEIDDGEEIDTPAEATQRLYGVKIKYQE